jgi:hypothetical protein
VGGGLEVVQEPDPWGGNGLGETPLVHLPREVRGDAAPVHHGPRHAPTEGLCKNLEIPDLPPPEGVKSQDLGKSVVNHPPQFIPKGDTSLPEGVICTLGSYLPLRSEIAEISKKHDFGPFWPLPLVGALTGEPKRPKNEVFPVFQVILWSAAGQSNMATSESGTELANDKLVILHNSSRLR